jgi:hypothetical protein
MTKSLFLANLDQHTILAIPVFLSSTGSVATPRLRMPGVPCQIEREREEHLDPSHKSPFARAMIGKLEKLVVDNRSSTCLLVIGRQIHECIRAVWNMNNHGTSR